MSRLEKVKTGLPGLDEAIQGIRLGENIMWQIVDIGDYAFLARSLAEEGLREGRKVIYFRFSESRPLLAEADGLEIVELDMNGGFETFTVSASEKILKQAPGTFYIFDCLTDLQSVWAADFMVRNFFRAICPIVHEAKGVAYYSIINRVHSYDSISQITAAASIFATAARGVRGMYIHPIKAVDRGSQKLFLPHLFNDDYTMLTPITDGISTSIYYQMVLNRTQNAINRYSDNWQNFFIKAQDAKNADPKVQEEYKDKMYKMLIGRDKEREKLFKENFEIQDYLDINRRLIGSGTIGGKAAGMLLARKIIQNERPDLEEYIEPHDSFYIGSNVFYTFLIGNNWWNLWMDHKTDEGYFMAARALKSQMPYGVFPELVLNRFRRMLDYFGNNPIIVRSSSLLEDGFGNAFAGKYDSVFCVNAGTYTNRLNQFIQAVKEVYVSAMDESALVYRKQRGLDKAEEQMSILVQRVSGSIYDDIFMPGAAGVGYSTNSYAWSKDIDPKAGVLRIVAGLGTRAVDRTLHDYPRIANLDKPELLPNSSPEDRFKFVQRNVDVLDFSDNTLLTIPIEEVRDKAPRWYSKMMIEHDVQTESRMREMGRDVEVIATSCDKILKNPEIVRVFSEIMRTIEDKYNYPVDIEYTINFTEDGDFLINLVQCRPLQSKGTGSMNVSIPDVPEEDTFFRLKGNIMGGPIDNEFGMLAIVDPKAYADMPYKDKYLVANAIEAINNHAGQTGRTLMLLGPGRWGTSSAELGVPVRFAQICNTSAIFEMSFESSGLMPELSFGSHFFQDLVENNTFYGAIFEADCSEGNASLYRSEFLAEHENVYTDIPGTYEVLKDVVSVYDFDDKKLRLVADSTDEAICFMGK